MIPLFKPSTAKKEVNKTQGDGELAKLANLNRLVEDVNTIVAQGLPASSPVFTYNATGGSVYQMQLSYLILTDQYTNGGTGDVTIQSHYVPSVNIYGDLSATSLTFYTDYIQSFSINYIGDTSSIDNLITLNFPNLLKQIEQAGIIGGLSELTTISAPLINTGVISIEQCHNLTTVDVSSMVNQSRLILRNCDLINLAGITHNSQFSGFDFTDCPNLESIISIPATDIYTYFSSCISVTSVSFPNAVNYFDGVDIRNCNNLTTISLGSIGTVKKVNYDVSLPSNALNAASVNAVLALLVSLDGTNGTTLFGPGRSVFFDGGTNAAPTGQGLTDKATLEARGATIDTN